MKKNFKMIAVFLLLAALFFAVSCSKSENKPDPLEITHKVLIETSEGKITLGLYGNGMPVTVENFIGYVDRGFYNGLIFHRVVKGFVIQGGVLDENLNEKETLAPIKLEMPPSAEVKDENGKVTGRKLLISHDKYTLAMARRREPDSAASQFYITLEATHNLDPNPSFDQPNGYAPFGKVLEGFEVVDKIGGKAVVNKNGYQGVPAETVKIVKMSVVERPQPKEEKK